MSGEIYYTAPSDDQFNELKDKAIKIWQGYDNQFGYVDEKVGRISGLKNVSDNFMYIVAMFDDTNQRKLSLELSPETKAAISERLVAGGQPEEFNHFK